MKKSEIIKPLSGNDAFNRARSSYLEGFEYAQLLAEFLDGKITPEKEVRELNGRLFKAIKDLQDLRTNFAKNGIDVPDPDPDGIFGTKTGNSQKYQQ